MLISAGLTEKSKGWGYTLLNIGVGGWEIIPYYIYKESGLTVGSDHF